MINSKEDYKNYLKLDAIALGKKQVTLFSYVKELLLPDNIYRFQRLMRKLEYFKNCKHDPISRLYFLLLYIKYNRLSTKLGFSIPLNVFGSGLVIVHYGTIVVNANAKVGSNCRIHPSTCIGASGGDAKAPHIGNNVYIAPGVKIYGNITLGNNIVTAANAAVGSSFLEENILIGGVPAKKIKDFDVKSIIKHI